MICGVRPILSIYVSCNELSISPSSPKPLAMEMSSAIMGMMANMMEYVKADDCTDSRSEMNPRTASTMVFSALYSNCRERDSSCPVMRQMSYRTKLYAQTKKSVSFFICHPTP